MTQIMIMIHDPVFSTGEIYV